MNDHIGLKYSVLWCEDCVCDRSFAKAEGGCFVCGYCGFSYPPPFDPRHWAGFTAQVINEARKENQR